MGCGLYTAGIVIAPEGGAFVAIEKRPRKTGKKTEVRHDGFNELEDVWEDALVVVGAERLSGLMPAMVARVADRLAAAPMADDTTAHLDTSTLGGPLRQMFYERECYPLTVDVGGEQETRDTKTGTRTVPARVLQNHVTLAMQTERLSVLEGISEGAALLGALSHVDTAARGPSRDLALATALAVWTADEYRTHGPWASRKPPPRDDASEWAREARRRAFERARRQADRPWWSHLSERDGWR